LDLEAVLRLLRSREGEPYERGDVRGSVAYAGAVSFGKLAYDWDVERPVPELLDLDEDSLARTLSALASPPRLRLISALLPGPRSTQQLQEVLGHVSTGQFYHHLKELLSARLVTQKERSLYAIEAHRIVPLLVVLAAAQDLTEFKDLP